MISMEPHEDNRLAWSSDDDDDVADAKLRSIHFLKRNEEFSNHDDDGENNKAPVQPHRYDEMGSFLTRSQRSVSHPDMPPTPEEAAQRKVQIKDGVVDEIHQMEPLTADETAAYFMGEEDFRRIDINVELTTMRWEKAVKVRRGEINKSSWVLTTVHHHAKEVFPSVVDLRDNFFPLTLCDDHNLPPLRKITTHSLTTIPYVFFCLAPIIIHRTKPNSTKTKIPPGVWKK